jgi:hypothetical protein
MLVSSTHDRITIDGQKSTVIDGQGADVFTIDGANGVVIKGFNVNNGYRGIFGRRGAVLEVQDITVQNSVSRGILIEQTHKHK